MVLIEQVDNLIPKPKYEYITTEEALNRAMIELDKYPIHSIDTETTGLDVFKAKLCLVQIGAGSKTYVIDTRYDLEYSNIHPKMLLPVLSDKSKVKILQNASYDMKMLKLNTGIYLENVYDTMLVEQLLNLGLYVKVGLAALVDRYLSLSMPKEPRSTFSDYYQKYQDFQLEYAANDVVVLPPIRDLQLIEVQKEGLEHVSQLEFDFLKPLCEMELNGVLIDVDKWKIMMSEWAVEHKQSKLSIQKELITVEDQSTLFGVPLINIDSNVQLKKALNKYGLNLEDTNAGTLAKFKGVPIIDAILDYRKTSKLISTYGDALLERIQPSTGRLHTSFKQMVSTGRMSSNDPNLQNIPAKQKYRSCFVAPEGYSMITADMSGAELRIAANLSQEPAFIEAYANGQDIHTRTASDVFKVPYDEVKTKYKHYRKSAKSLNFGLFYGMSAVGLAARLGKTKKEAEDIINEYFGTYRELEKFLNEAGKNAVKYRYTKTISGRKRYYNMPPYNHPDRKKIQGAIERQGKNAGVQGANADTIKAAMILLVKRLEKYDARLVLTVHDEVVVETRNDQREEVSEVVAQSLVDGFGKYFTIVPMETDAVIGPCWLKGGCEKCGNNVTEFAKDPKYGTRLVCAKCRELQD